MLNSRQLNMCIRVYVYIYACACILCTCICLISMYEVYKTGDIILLQNTLHNKLFANNLLKCAETQNFSKCEQRSIETLLISP